MQKQNSGARCEPCPALEAADRASAELLARANAKMQERPGMTMRAALGAVSRENPGLNQAWKNGSGNPQSARPYPEVS